MSITERDGAAAKVRDDNDALEIAGELAAEFAVDAAERDRRQIAPTAEIEAMSMSGLLAITVPVEYGGADVRAGTVAEVVRRLAVADPAIAQLATGHFGYLQLLRLAANAWQRETLFAEVLAGGRVARAQAEPTSPNVVQLETTLRPIGRAGFVLNGVKCFSVAAAFADRVAVLARLDDPGEVSGLAAGEYVAYLPVETPGLSIEEDGIGRPSYVSTTVRCRDVQVPPEYVVPRRAASQQPHSVAALAQLLQAAIGAGIARGALAEAITASNTDASPGAANQPIGDGLCFVRKIGELEVDVSAAEALLATASDSVEEALRMPWERTASDASIAVATAKILAERAAMNTASALVEIGGGRTVLDTGAALIEIGGDRTSVADLNLGRHWRNARMHTAQDPVRWKYHHIGRHTLSGIAPPRHGAI